MTPSGKVDRLALPAPSRQRSVPENLAPRTPVEKGVAEIWKEILNIDRVSVTDNFFELGGHSLLATRVASRVSDSFGLQIPLRRIFEKPILEGFAFSIAEDIAGSEQPERINQLVAEVSGLSDEEALLRLASEGRAEKESL